MNKIKIKIMKNKIRDDFSINLFLSDSYILEKKIS